PEALSIRGRSEESLARGSRTERAAAQGLARPGDGRHRKGERAVRLGAAGIRSARGTVPKACRRAGDARHRHAQSRNSETDSGGGENRGGASAGRPIFPKPRGQKHRPPPQRPTGPLANGTSSQTPPPPPPPPSH